MTRRLYVENLDQTSNTGPVRKVRRREFTRIDWSAGLAKATVLLECEHEFHIEVGVHQRIRDKYKCPACPKV